jgi:hypothetical protein
VCWIRVCFAIAMLVLNFETSELNENLFDTLSCLRHAMAKPTECVCDQHGSRPACASAQSDQDPCCSLTSPIISWETDSEHHGS